MATKVRLTAQDLWRLGEGDIRRELVDGEVIEMAPAGGVHGELAARICRRLLEYVDGSARLLREREMLEGKTSCRASPFPSPMCWRERVVSPPLLEGTDESRPMFDPTIA